MAGVLFASAAVGNQVDIAVSGSTVDSSSDFSSDVLVVIAALLIPLAIGIAVLRYRLYDIDLIISRTLVYGPLTATLAGTYTASIIFFRLLFVDVLSVSSDAAVASTTLLLAALFVPARNKIQVLVDRFFKEDEYRRLMAFSKEAANAADLMSQEVVARRFLSLAIAATGASGCKIALDGVGQGTKEYAEGSLGTAGGVVLPLHADGRQVGRLELGAPPNGNRFRDAELDSVTGAAVLVARSLAFHEVR